MTFFNATYTFGPEIMEKTMSKWTLVPILFLLSLAFSTNGLALSPTSNPVPEPSAPPVEFGANINSLVITGTVRKIPGGTALVTPNGTYLLAGGNFDGIVGRQVNILGTIIKEGSVEILRVARAQLASQ